MPALALGLYLIGLVLAFGVRSYLQWRQTGDTGLRFDAGPPGSVRWFAKLMFLVALGLGVAGPVAALAGLDPLVRAQWLPAAGVGVTLVGLGMTLLAQSRMGRSWRVGVDPGERTDLVTGGVFGLVRNPIFSAMVVTSTGLALMVPNPVALVATGVLVASIQVQVRTVEEPYLTRVHGRDYLAYAARVGRFVPGVGTIRP